MSVRDMRVEQHDVRSEKRGMAAERAMEKEEERENPVAMGNLDGFGTGKQLREHVMKLHGGAYMDSFLRGLLADLAEGQSNEYLGDYDPTKGKVARRGAESLYDYFTSPAAPPPRKTKPAPSRPAVERSESPPYRGNYRGPSTQKPIRSQQLELYDNGPRFSKKPMKREDSEMSRYAPQKFDRDTKQSRAYGSYLNDTRGRALPAPADLGGFYNQGRINKPSNQMVVKKQQVGRGMRGAGAEGKADMEGSGFLSSLGIPVVSDLAGMFGLGTSGGGPEMGARCVGGLKTGRYEGQGQSGGKAKRPASEKMKARGAMVSKLMKEKGMTLGQASKYIKEHGS